MCLLGPSNVELTKRDAYQVPEGSLQGKKTFPIIEQTKPAEKKSGLLRATQAKPVTEQHFQVATDNHKMFFPAGRKYQIIKSYNH